jgi:phage shock protein PspC (stress-responsive transcriptional regulator)
MKETINANIGGEVFVLDRDAYDRLTIYLNDVRRRLTADADEVMKDIEIRIAEILHEELPSSMMVVTLAMTERAIARIGAPEDFGDESTTESTNEHNTMNTKKLRRSRSNRSIAGVCAGVADYLGIDTTPLRILTYCLFFFGGMSLWVYIIAWLLIPEE